MSTENKITVGSVCFIEDPDGKKLLLLNRSREPMQGLVTGVGGKTNFDEDIRLSCIREVKEETGLYIEKLELKGVIKTLLEGSSSSWILFVYTAKALSSELQDCDEGELLWIERNEVMSQNLIEFIRLVLPHILKAGAFVEGTITHDKTGKVIDKTISVSNHN